MSTGGWCGLTTTVLLLAAVSARFTYRATTRTFPCDGYRRICH